MAGVARPTATPVPAFGDGKDQSDLLLETGGGPDPPSPPCQSSAGEILPQVMLCQGTAGHHCPFVPTRPLSACAQRARATQILARSFQPLLQPPPNCPWALNRRVPPRRFGAAGRCCRHPAQLGSARRSFAASGRLPRPPATCGGSAAGTVPPRQLRGAAKPQKCALNKPARLNEGSSCPIKSEASLSSGTPWRDRTGVPGWDAAPA